MLAVLGAMVPIFALIVVGLLLRRYGPYGDGFWLPAERLNYFFLFPALLFMSLATVEIAEVELLPMAMAMAGAVVLMSAATYGVPRLMPIQDPSFAALFQGAIRVNTYVAIAVAAALYDSAGLTLVSAGVAVVIPLVNVLSVLVLSRHGTGAVGRGPGALRQIARNPIILACLAGIVLNLVGLDLPGVVARFLEIVGRAALPLGLLSVGAGLDLGAARGAGRAVGVATLLKLLALPFLTAVLCLILGVHGMTAAVAILFNGCPSSASSYILTRQLGGDHRLMAGIITVQTLAGMVTLPLLLVLIWQIF